MNSISSWVRLFFLVYLTVSLASPGHRTQLFAYAMNEPQCDTTGWSELVGKDGETAKTFILQKNPEMRVDVLPHDAMMTMDYRTDRVRVMVDEQQKVVREPRVG
mmetsp:Transcript_33055/g.48908  ORF Transcript_33055/g.48908 Transcript_33055/m.48908 type:complete len:104 (-) Transcript_33055:925-1236(-)